MRREITGAVLGAGVVAGVLGGVSPASASTATDAGLAASSKGCRSVDTSFEDVTKVRRHSFTTKSGTYRFDRNDSFAVGAEGDRLTYRQFKRELSVGDGVQIFRYCSRRAGKSGFALIEYADSTASR